MPATYDAIIIGAGHNGLVTACLPRPAPAGRCWCWNAGTSSAAPASPRRPSPASRSPRPPTSTACFARRSSATCAWPTTASPCSNAIPSSFTPFPDGRYLHDGPATRTLTLREIAKFSARDAENYPKYEAMLERVADVIEPTLMHAAAEPAAAGAERSVEHVQAGPLVSEAGRRA